MFENTRTGAKAGELRAYASEDESSARTRLEAAGWKFQGVNFEFKDKVFKVIEGGEGDADDEIAADTE